MKADDADEGYYWEPEKDANGDFYTPFYAKGATFFNYWLTYLSTFIHVITMAVLMDCWCNWSKIAIGYSFQFFLIHAYSWAIPDRRYTSWIHKHQTTFYTLAILNLVVYVAGISGGLCMYFGSDDGIFSLLGLSVVCFQLCSCTPMVVCIIWSMICL